MGWGKRVNLFSFLKVVLHNQINKNEAHNTVPANVLPFYIPLTPVWGQKVKTFFLKVMVHITLCNSNVCHYVHTWPFGLGKKVRH